MDSSAQIKSVNTSPRCKQETTVAQQRFGNLWHAIISRMGIQQFCSSQTRIHIASACALTVRMWTLVCCRTFVDNKCMTHNITQGTHYLLSFWWLTVQCISIFWPKMHHRNRESTRNTIKITSTSSSSSQEVEALEFWPIKQGWPHIHSLLFKWLHARCNSCTSTVGTHVFIISTDHHIKSRRSLIQKGCACVQNDVLLNSFKSEVEHLLSQHKYCTKFISLIRRQLD